MASSGNRGIRSKIEPRCEPELFWLAKSSRIGSLSATLKVATVGSIKRRSTKHARVEEDCAELPLVYQRTNPVAREQRHPDAASFAQELASFREFGRDSRRITTAATLFDGQRLEVPTYVNEFWTARQRQASTLQEISYRACFKPQLPRFFIERLSKLGEVVYDPFMGRG